MAYLAKLKGLSQPLPGKTNIGKIAFSWMGGFIAITCLAMLGIFSQHLLLMGSFGASCFILFALPNTPFAQPRNVIGGHFISSLVGLIFFHLLGPDWWSMALALATCVACMQLFRVSHPPAGSNPIIVFLSAPQWDFLLTPTLLGACTLVIVALFYNNLPKQQTYPLYW